MDRALGKIGLLALLLVRCVLSAHEYEQFLHATTVAQDGDYAQALSLYDTCQTEGYGLLFNKACCLHKIGQHAQSLALLYKALRFARGTECSDLYALVDKVYMDAGYTSHKTIHDVCVRTAAPYVSYVPILLFQCIWVFLLWLLCYIIYVYRGYVRTILFLILMIVLLFVTGILLVKKSMHMMDKAIVKEQTTLLYAGPNERYTTVSSLSQGMNITLLEEKRDWIKVAYKQHVGWVFSSAVCRV